MKEDLFTVHFIPKSNCFLYLPESSLQSHLRNGTNSKCCLQMRYGNAQRAYFSSSPQAHGSESNDSVGISAAYARALGLKENEQVWLSCITLNSAVTKINVCLTSLDDWDVMELSLNSVQSSLLNQVRVVWPGQTLVVWVSKYLHFSLRVDSIHPNTSVGMLETFTDLVISLPGDEAQQNDLDAQHSTSSVGTNEVIKVSDDEHRKSRSVQVNESNLRATTFWDSILKTLLSSFSTRSNQTSRPQKMLNSSPPISRPHKSEAAYRVHPLQTSSSNIDNNNAGDVILCQPCNVFVHKCHLSPEIVRLLTEREVVVCKLSKMPRADNTNEEQEGIATVNSEDSPQMPKIASLEVVYARLYIIEDVYNSLSSKAKKWFFATFVHSEHRCILVSNSIRRALKVDIGGRVHVSPELHKNVELSDLTIIEIVAQNVALSDTQVTSLFQDFIRTQTLKSSLLLSSQIIVYVPQYDAEQVSLALSTPNQKYVLLDSVSMRKCSLKVNRAIQNVFTNAENLEDNSTEISSSFFGSNLSDLVSEGFAMLELGLGLHPSGLSRPANILIVGNPGSGKSTLAQHLCHTVKQAPHFVHCVEVQCCHLKGKTVESLHKLLTQCIAECIFHQPAVLLLDDLDAIVGMSSQIDERSAEAAYNYRVGEMLADTLDQVQLRNSVVVMATVPSILNLSASVSAARGQHLFKTTLQITDLNKKNRLQLLAALISEKTKLPTNHLQLEAHAGRAEGYVAQDIADMVDKAVFEALRRRDINNTGPRENVEVQAAMNNTVPIEDVDVQAAMNNTVPIEDVDVQAAMNTTVPIEDVDVQAAMNTTVPIEDVDVQAAMNNTVPLSLHGVTLFKDAAHSWADVGGLTSVKRVLVEALQWPAQYADLFKRCPLRHQAGLLLYGAPGTGKTLLAGAVAHECGLNFISVKGPELLSKYIGASEEAVRSIFHKAQSAQPCVLFFDEFDSLAPRRGHDSTGVTDRVVNQLLTQLDGVEALVGVWVMAATSRPDLLDPALLRPGRLDRAIHCSLPEPAERADILQALSRRLKLAADVDFTAVAACTQGFTGADLQALLYTAQLAALEQDMAAVVTQRHLLTALQDTRPSLSSAEIRRYQTIYNKFVGARSGKSRDLELVSQRITLA